MSFLTSTLSWWISLTVSGTVCSAGESSKGKCDKTRLRQDMKYSRGDNSRWYCYCSLMGTDASPRQGNPSNFTSVFRFQKALRLLWSALLNLDTRRRLRPGLKPSILRYSGINALTVVGPHFDFQCSTDWALPYWPRSSVGRALEDLIQGSWVQTLPRSNFHWPVGTPKFPLKG